MMDAPTCWGQHLFPEQVRASSQKLLENYGKPEK